MAIKNFPNDLYVSTITDGDTPLLGTLEVSEHTEMSHLLLSMFKKGVHTGLEKMQIRIYESQKREVPAFSSNIVNVTDFENITASNWLGDIRFDFGRVNLVPGSRYSVELHLSNYIRSANTYYLSTVIDWPIAQNAQLNNEASSKFTIWGYK